LLWIRWFIAASKVTTIFCALFISYAASGDMKQRTRVFWFACAKLHEMTRMLPIRP
jgi:hypothetical protein